MLYVVRDDTHPGSIAKWKREDAGTRDLASHPGFATQSQDITDSRFFLPRYRVVVYGGMREAHMCKLMCEHHQGEVLLQ